MSSQAEVRRLAGAVLAAYPRLDVLVNNAGGFWATRRVTADGLEHTFAVNHLAPFLLTSLLLDRLKASAPARIVTVSSGVHTGGTINFDDLQGERRYSGQQAYSQSKLANVMFTYELARRLDGTGVTATALHPGVVRTGFAAEDPSAMLKVFLPLIRVFLKTPDQGAATSIYLASAPEARGRHRRVFRRPQAEDLQPVLPRHLRRGQALAGQPRPHRTYRRPGPVTSSHPSPAGVAVFSLGGAIAMTPGGGGSGRGGCQRGAGGSSWTWYRGWGPGRGGRVYGRRHIVHRGPASTYASRRGFDHTYGCGSLHTLLCRLPHPCTRGGPAG